MNDVLEKRHDDCRFIDPANDSERPTIDIFTVDAIRATSGLKYARFCRTAAGLNVRFRNRPLPHAPRCMNRQEKSPCPQSSDDFLFIAHRVLT